MAGAVTPFTPPGRAGHRDARPDSHNKTHPCRCLTCAASRWVRGTGRHPWGWHGMAWHGTAVLSASPFVSAAGQRSPGLSSGMGAQPGPAWRWHRDRFGSWQVRSSGSAGSAMRVVCTVCRCPRAPRLWPGGSGSRSPRAGRCRPSQRAGRQR